MWARKPASASASAAHLKAGISREADQGVSCQQCETLLLQPWSALETWQAGKHPATELKLLSAFPEKLDSPFKWIESLQMTGLWEQNHPILSRAGILQEAATFCDFTELSGLWS